MMSTHEEEADAGRDGDHATMTVGDDDETKRSETHEHTETADTDQRR